MVRVNELNEALQIKKSEADIMINSGSEWKLESIPKANSTILNVLTHARA